MTFNTGNPLGSSDFKDLSDNAENFDKFANGPADAYPNRFGESKLSISGMDAAFNAAEAERKAEFDAALAGIGFVWIGDYAAGLTLTTRQQYVLRSGIAYILNSTTAIPYTLSGVWAEDLPNLKELQSDQVLRLDLASADSGKGANLVSFDPADSYSAGTVGGRLKDLSTLAVGKGAALIPFDPEQAYPAGSLGEAVSSGSGRSKVSPGSLLGGVLTFDPRDAGLLSHTVTADVTLSLPLSGAPTDGLAYKAKCLFTQDVNGGWKVAPPAGTLLPTGVTGLVSNVPGSITYVEFDLINGGNWIVTVRTTFVPSVSVVFPPIADENATFNDEGDATTGWSITGGTISSAASAVRNTKTAGTGTSSVMTKTVTYPSGAKDFLLYGKIRARYAAGMASVLWIGPSTKKMALWLGSINGGGASGDTLGAISLRGTVGAAATAAAVTTGVNYETTAVEFVLWYDAKYSTLSCYLRNPEGGYSFGARVNCENFQGTTVELLTSSNSAAGNWIEFDYITLARPNLVNIGDSIQEGKTLFANDPALGLTNYLSTWMAHAPIYKNLRNNFIVNKGVGGNSSAQILARIADATDLGPRVIFLGASNNDYASSISQATRTSNIQASVNAINASGAKAILINSLYGGSAPVVAGNPVIDGSYRAYHKTWWDTYRPTVTGLYSSINQMNALKNAGDDYVNAGYLQSDGVHPNVSGYTAYGNYIAAL